jgi:hypothetical protein
MKTQISWLKGIGIVLSMATTATARAWRAIALAAACALAAASAHAQVSREGGERVSASEIGHASHAWLDLQRSNAAAAPLLPMLGAEAGPAYERYLDSFRSKIPSAFGSTTQSNSSALHVDEISGSSVAPLGN